MCIQYEQPAHTNYASIILSLHQVRAKLLFVSSSLTCVNLILGTKLVNVEVYLYSSEDEDRWGYFDENYTFPPEVQAMESIEAIKVLIRVYSMSS